MEAAGAGAGTGAGEGGGAGDGVGMVMEGGAGGGAWVYHPHPPAGIPYYPAPHSAVQHSASMHSANMHSAMYDGTYYGWVPAYELDESGNVLPSPGQWYPVSAAAGWFSVSSVCSSMCRSAAARPPHDPHTAATRRRHGCRTTAPARRGAHGLPTGLPRGLSGALTRPGLRPELS